MVFVEPRSRLMTTLASAARLSAIVSLPLPVTPMEEGWTFCNIGSLLTQPLCHSIAYLITASPSWTGVQPPFSNYIHKDRQVDENLFGRLRSPQVHRFDYRATAATNVRK